ncbi:taperin [Hemicordylus capensis]|uniref:taperin n=1 Tax=Hemicordylus capensis TaxID=884348 RepID=UPI00230288E2|nr:taperin [Hemicordylus capensis]
MGAPRAAPLPNGNRPFSAGGGLRPSLPISAAAASGKRPNGRRRNPASAQWAALLPLSAGGEARVLPRRHCEAVGGVRWPAAAAASSSSRCCAAAAAMSGPLASGLPAWKRALLERKRAKLAAGVEPERGRPAEQPLPPTSEGEEEAAAAAAGPAERLVVAESLGPLRENPFMRLESERRRRRRRFLLPPLPLPPAASSPEPPAPTPPPPPSPSSAEPPALAQLLELYSSVPGIRTIRADNILIIESREAEAAPPAPPGHPHTGGDSGTDSADSPRWAPRPGPPLGPPSPHAGSGWDAFRELLSRSGSAVTEIRAAEVVIYEPQPPSSPTAAAGLGGSGSEPGRVSRLLQKFDRRGNVARGRWRGGDAPQPEPAVPNPSLEKALSSPTARPGLGLGSPRGLQPGGFMQKIGSNSFTVNPRGCRPGPLVPRPIAPVLSNGPVESKVATVLPAPSGGRSRQGAAAPKPVPSPSANAASLNQANAWKPKPEGAVEIPLPPQSSASLESSATASWSQSTPHSSSNCSFEIHPAPKPDLAAIPAHDLKAQALASLRLNSRNSFLFVPRRKGDAASPPEPTEVPPSLPGGALPPAPKKPAETLVPVTYIDEDLVELDADLPPLKVLSPRLEGFDVLQESNSSLEMEDSAVPMYKPHVAGFAPSQKGSNTFTVVPKRKPPSAGLETFRRAQLLLEEEEEEEEEIRAKVRTDAPHQELGHLLKKRYPTVNEIEVIGGYLSLDRSCMSKSGSQRKKMKISFNESSLQTMFEYPSESSLVEEEEEDEDEYATEVDETPASLGPHSNGNNSGLSSYTPKHSTEFSKWQKEQYEEMPPSTGAFPWDADLPGNQVMLTPADKSSLSDFSSEPALYF